MIEGDGDDDNDKADGDWRWIYYQHITHQLTDLLGASWRQSSEALPVLTS